jgi:glutamate racemase
LHQSYFADDAFRPYGRKSQASLRARLPALLAPLCDILRPDIVVIACNTASTTALPAIRAALPVPVVGVVPAIKPAAAQSTQKRIAVLGTPGTVKGPYVDDLIARHAADCEVRLRGSVDLVEQAERQLRGLPVDDAKVAREIAPLFAGDPIDVVVLACTHFPLLRDRLVQVAPYPVTWIDSGAAVARRVQHLLQSGDAHQVSSKYPLESLAFTTQIDDDPAQRRAFCDYGFDRLIALPGPMT